MTTRNTTKFLGITVLERTTEDVPQQVAQVVEPITQSAPSKDVVVTRSHRNVMAYNEGMTYINSWPVSFNGEKNVGELGPIRNYQINFEELRMRHHQLMLESDVLSTLLNRKVTWIIGEGLKLQSEPNLEVLEDEGIKLTPDDAEALSKKIENRFKIFSSSTMCDYSDMRTLPKIMQECYTNAQSGDVLVLLRVINNCVKIEIIDGCHLKTPATISFDPAKGYVWANGNRVINGVEIDNTGKHVAYHVCKNYLETTRIEAVGKSGHVMAFLVYGKRLRLNHVRGITDMAPVMESAKKLERYKEATVGSAEERQKLAWFVTHELGSTNENPMLKQLATGMNPDKAGDIPTTVDGKELANKFYASHNKTLMNLPNGADIKVPDTKPELSFSEFFKANVESICAAAGIPPEVAMSKYDSNYSASRGAMKDWEHTIFVGRSDFAAQFCARVYALWLEVEILNNKINAPGYLKAVQEDNRYAVEAYRSARWVGAGVPQIDPVKEVEAIIRAINAGLLTIEAGTEALGNGDAKANLTQLGKELEFAKEKGVVPNFGTTVAAPPADNNGGSGKPTG